MERLPPQGDVENEILQVLNARLGAMRTTAIYATLADQFRLNRSERYGCPTDPRGSRWEFVVRLARKALQRRGLLHSPEAGAWELTGSGREAAQKMNRQHFDA